jgi:sulfur carrier protein
MIQLSFNGDTVCLPTAHSISELLHSRGLGERRVAVERNGEIVPRSQHDSTQVVDGDRIEVVMAIGGG